MSRPVNNKDRKLMMCGGPCVRLEGQWLKAYGFSTGDQVLITNPEPGVLVMKINLERDAYNVIRAEIENEKAIAAIAAKRAYEAKFGKAVHKGYKDITSPGWQKVR